LQLQLHENLQGQIQDFLRGGRAACKKQQQQQQQHAIIFVMKND